MNAKLAPLVLWVFALSILLPATGCKSVSNPADGISVSPVVTSNTAPKIGIIYNREQAEQLEKGGNRLTSYARAIEENGGTVVILSPLLSKRETKARLDSLDALLIPGGEDINPARYHEKPDPKLEACDNELDAYECKVLDRAAARGIEILGICRGLQVLNVWAGGTLWQDLPSELGTNVIHRRLSPSGDALPCYHGITIEPGSFLWTLFQTNRLTVNSYHHQGVDKLAGRFHAVARSDDGLVEAFEDRTDQIRAVQFHPERLRLEPGYTSFNCIFSDFVSRAAAAAQKRAEVKAVARLAP